MNNQQHSALAAYLNPRTAALAAIGFASGLPFALTGTTLQAWMTDAGVSLTAIGLFSLVSIPYSYKFIWSPLMDRYVPPFLGRRRGWMLVIQVGLMGGLCGMALVGPTPTSSLQNSSPGTVPSIADVVLGFVLNPLAMLALLVAFLSASQDIAADAYRTDVLPASDRGAGAAVFVTGWRIAFLFSTAAALMLADRISWSGVYLLMAAAMGVGVIASLFAPEAQTPPDAPQSLQDAVVRPFVEFLRRPLAWGVLVFIVLFKLPDVLLDGMKISFLMRELQFTKEQIGLIAQGVGLATSIGGALLGGAVVARLGLWRSLWIFGALQALSNLGFWAMLPIGHDLSALTAVIVTENFCAGLVTAGFVAFLMSQCDRRFSATQYALLSSLMAQTRLVAGTSGWLADSLGWNGFFAVTLLAALPGMALLAWLRPAVHAGAEPQEPPPRGFEVIPVAQPVKAM